MYAYQLIQNMFDCWPLVENYLMNPLFQDIGRNFTEKGLSLSLLLLAILFFCYPALRQNSWNLALKMEVWYLFGIQYAKILDILDNDK